MTGRNALAGWHRTASACMHFKVNNNNNKNYGTQETMHFSIRIQKLSLSYEVLLWY